MQNAFANERQMERAMQMFAKHLNIDSKLIVLHHIAAVFAPQGGAAPVFTYGEAENIISPKVSMFMNLINLSNQSCLEIMAHEMIHVSQMLNKRLRYTPPTGAKLEVQFCGHIGMMVPNKIPNMFWEGQDWSHAWYQTKVERCYETYRSLPWEKEAFELQAEVASLLTFVELQELEELGREQNIF